VASRQKQQNDHVRAAKERRQAIGRRVRDCRKQSGLTQDTVAEQAGLAEATLRAVEAGRRGPSVDSITAIAGALGVPVSTFFSDDAVADGSGAEAARLFRELDERLQPVVIRFMRDMGSALSPKGKRSSSTSKAKDRA
jgi:transcriptional regulator with XRE-family HTH domain